MERKHGYVKDVIEADHYVLGGGFMPQKIILNPKGDWTEYLPTFEAQAGKFDTFGCAIFGTENCVEAILRRLEAKETNYSERFPYIGLRVRPPGTSPHAVAEWIRGNGLVAQDVMPMTETFEEFCKPDPLPVNLLEKGQQFLDKWQFFHEWVYKEGDKNAEAKLREALKYSPLGVSVHAWKKNGKVYFKNEGDIDNHWCMLYKIDDKGYKHIFDSYDGVKVLAPDYTFDMAKMYFLFPETEKRDHNKIIRVGILQRLINFLQQLFNKQVEEEKKIMNDLQPLLRRKLEELESKCKTEGLPIKLVEGFRSIERQDELYAQGRTKPGKIVTNAKGGQSYHNYGCAFDVNFVKGDWNVPNSQWEKIGVWGEQLGLEWGGRWAGFSDKPHFQITFGYSYDDFAKGRVDYSKYN